ncbi:transcription elongation factor Spt6 [Morchella conica CCBAS932]|uniref:Transcription elongation factor Spt6 n=1 Tax=Morchella conica CCBAS932 TaxID=1392247 RepID=A0A3N4KN04_9PEZI|nr:transcription elongation factor Spt6 [Morchella conica CCBAS932]
MALGDFIEREAQLDDEEEDEELDDDLAGEHRKSGLNGKQKRQDPEDSSEEEDDDDDEEAAKIAQGFIVDDEDEEEEEQDDGSKVMVKGRKKKRSRSQREDDEEEGLDEDDFDLIGENTGFEVHRANLKRLKRGPQGDDGRRRKQSRDLDDIFSDEEADAPGEPDDDDEGLSNMRAHGGDRGDARGLVDVDEFADFIEEDSGDEGRQGGSDDDMQMAGQRSRGGDRGRVSYAPEHLNLREGAISDMQDIFGRGDEYDFALITEEDQEEEGEDKVKDLELKDVFEPSELAERMLTDEDNEIRLNDVPERYQIARKPYAHLRIGRDEIDEEGDWISKFLIPKKRLTSHLVEALVKAIKKILEFFILEDMEVPFVFQHRKDYLIHAEKVPKRQYNDNEAQYEIVAERLISQDDLWEILELDLKFRAYFDKRHAFMRTYDQLKHHANVEDREAEEGIRYAETSDQLQDMHDYIHFRYHSQLKDIALNGVEGRGNHFRRPGNAKTMFERIRNGKVYGLVRAFGISASQFSVNVQLDQKREFAEDPLDYPHTMSDEYIEIPEFASGESALQAAKFMLAEEMFTNPSLRKALRERWFTRSLIHVNVTEKGVKKIDEQHQYYEFKYLRNQTMQAIAAQPGMYLRMMKAESDGLVEINIELQNEEGYTRRLYDYITSENVSDIADAWNKERKDVVDLAMAKFRVMFQKNVKDELRTACEDAVASECRRNYSKKLDQAPYKPKALKLGEIPRVFALSNGQGERGRDALVGIFRDEDGRVLESVKYSDLKDEKSRQELVDALQRRKPDVIGVSGFSVQTHKLVEDLRQLVEQNDIVVTGEEDEKIPIEVVYVNDEVARLYHNSERAMVDHPDLPPLARYCVALARYVQNPLLEYAGLGKDIVSIVFHPAQQLLPEDKLQRSLDSAIVDMVNLVGVDINEAASKPYVATLVPYVCGLGPRKATSVLKTIQANGGRVSSRIELLGDNEKGLGTVVGPRVFVNCASFLIIPHDPSDRNSDYLDNTRVHPEDYDLGRKMAADALDIDEEDVAAMVVDGGPGAVINELINGQEDKVNELSLEDYAEELERNFNQKKRATLETIRAELQHAYEELRNRFNKLSTEEIFTMLTGETRETLDEGMVVPVNIRRVTDRFIAARLDCGIEGNVSIDEMHNGTSHFTPSSMYSIGQTVQARIENINTRTFYAELSLREDKVRNPKRKNPDVPQEEWDDAREERDKARLAVTNQEQTRTARVIKHPLFKPFNSRQAEEFLAGQSRGDAVIRPSSNGPDHIAVTWKVSDNIYQHIDVLELDKENEFTVGRTLRVGGRFSYSDLDELIVNHIKAMARKVDELTHNSKFRSGTKADCEKWLEKYCEANPKRSTYGFCFDTKHPGYFLLMFKAGAASPVGSWPVKIIPSAFQLRDTPFPDMMTLCNGFKTMFMHSQKSRARM